PIGGGGGGGVPGVPRECGGAATMLNRTNRPAYGDPVPPPLNRNGVEEALAVMRKVAEHYTGTDAGRALEVAANQLSKLEAIPERGATKQRERGLRLRYLKISPHYAAKTRTVRGFVRLFLADADHYLKHRSKYDDKLTGRPRFEPWLSVARIIDLCDEIPSENTIRRDLQ
ncbi:hypothetical protein, partial [Mesorhizobium sp.]|uniref:hypothetical protein n=2 Tax=Mesorhizobium TaxID=68287 RepID=UPI0025D5731A